MTTTVDSPQRDNPFPGLRPFRSDEHHLFFGREEQTAALLQLLRTNRFLAVVGTSGSGKSSLVRAGMIAALHGGIMTHAGSTWEVLVLRPGGNPVENLARAFVDADLYDREDAGTLPRLLATLKRSRFGLVEAMKQSDVFEPGTNLLVVIDQFEELFRFRQQGVESEETASAFVNLLLTASEQAECPIYVTITMRSDYLGDCSEIPGLAEKVNEGEYLIPRLSRDQKRAAIEKPIGVGGAKISPLLAQRLLNDVGDDPDQLPVLQHALMRTWDAWSAAGDPQRMIDFADFEATGGLGAALSNHADEIYNALPDDRHRVVCAKVFKALTEKGDDNRGIRRPTRLAHLQEIAASDRATVTAVLDAFRAPGVTFLMPGTEVELGDRTVLDLSHESLMRGWKRLRGWVEDEAQSARIFRRLLDTARLWSDGRASLFRDPDLQIGLSWREQESPNAAWAGQYGGHFEKALAFLETSSAAAQAELQAKEAARQRELDQARQLAEVQKLRLEQQQRSARRLRVMIGGVAGIAVIAIVACAFALIANQRANTLAEEANKLAEKARDSATRAEKAQKATADALVVVESQKAEVDDSLSKAKAAERLRAAAEDENRKLLYVNDMRIAPSVLSDDPSTAEQLRLLLARHNPAGQPGKKENDPATTDLRGFEWYYHQHMLEDNARVFAGHGDPIADGTLTPNGQLVTLDQVGQVRRWNLSSQGKEDEAKQRDLLGGAGAQLHVLSPDGRLAALAKDNEVHVFDTATGKKTCKIDSADVAYRRLIFSQDEGRLVIVDNKIRWCDALNGAVIASIENDSNKVTSLGLSADGLTLAVVGHPAPGKHFSIFHLDAAAKTITPAAVKNFGLYGTFAASALSPDGQKIALGSKENGMVFVLDVAVGRQIANYGIYTSPPITTIAFSGDGAQLATADTQGTIKIWDAPKGFVYGRMQRALRGHQGAIHSVGFSSDGKQLISTSSDKTARVWDLGLAGSTLRPLEGLPHNRTLGARFSPDGLWIAAAGGPVQQQQVWDPSAGRYVFAPSGGGVLLWDAATGRLVRKLPVGGKSGALSIAFSPTDSRLMAVGHGAQEGDSSVSLWDIDAGKEIAQFPSGANLPDKKIVFGGVGALAFSRDGKYLIAGFGAKDYFVGNPSSPIQHPLAVWEVASRRLIHRLPGHTGICVALDVSRDGKLLASASRDGTAILWSTETWDVVHNLKNPDARTPQGQGWVEDVAFAPDGKTLAMASRERNVHLWDVASGKRLETLRGHINAVQAVTFSPDGRTLASAGLDRTFRLWNVQMRRELMQLDPGPQMQNVQSLAFSPDGKHLLAGGFGSGLWSAARNVWDDADLAAAKLGRLLKSNADFPSRIRMASENIRLYEALAKLDARDAQIRSALAATRANWHASQQRWDEAAKEFDRLPEPRADEAGAWLRTPGLVRLATALVHQDRPADSAMLLVADAKRRDQDGLGPIASVITFGFKFNVQGSFVRVTELLPGSRASRSKLLAGDGIVKVNGVEIPANPTIPDLTKMLAGGVGTKLRLTVRHQNIAQTEDIDLVKELYFVDEATGSLFLPLQTALAKRLAKDPGDAGLLELRAELHLAADTDFANQAAELTSVIKILTDKPGKTASASLQRLYRRRADAYIALGKWAEAVDDYAHVITPKTTDVVLISNRARAFEGVKQWEAAAADWTRVAAGNPEGAKLLADFTRRLVDAAQVPLADATRARARALFEAKLAQEPENATLAAELADLLLAPRGDWTVLVPAEMKAETGAKMELQKDGSVFVHQIKPPRNDTYTLVFQSKMKGIKSLRLEVLRDSRLPEGGPGWGGNFHLKELTLQAASSASPDNARPLALRNAWADHSEVNMHTGNSDVRSVVDGNRNGAWGIWPQVNKDHTAVFDTAEPIGDGQAWRLTVQLNHLSKFPGHNIGRFRLSFSTDPATRERAPKEFAAMKLTDPWAKLAAGYALNGRHEEAVRYFRLAYKQTDDYQARAGIIEYAALFEDILFALGQQYPDDLQWQFALARKLAEQGRKHLAAKEPARAQAKLEQARAAFQRSMVSADHWRTLAPIEIKAETGANMEIQKDGSVFVRQKQPPRNDIYTLVFKSDLKEIKGMRLEVLTDPRLPHGGPGLASNGNFHLNELSLQAAPNASPDKAKSIALRNAWADHSEVNAATGGMDVRALVDGNRKGIWSIWPQVNKNHTAVFDTAEPVGDGQSWRLTVRLSHTQLHLPDHNMGRFRLSFTNDAATLLEARKLLNPKAGELVELEVALAKAYAQQGQAKDAIIAIARALDQAPDRLAKTTILAEAEALPGVLPILIERADGDARVQAALALHFADKGNKPLASAARTKARALFEKQLTVEPGKAALASELADLLWSTLPPVDYFWIDDAAPPGAALQGNTPWEFVGPPDHPVFRGKKSTRRQAKGFSQHFFTGAAPGLKIGAGARLFAYVFLDPQDPPKTIMMQFNDGSWEHRVFWGDDLTTLGNLGTESRLSMGPLPKAGVWVRLEVDASKVGLDTGKVLRGWSFAQHGGTVYWDAAGTTLTFDDPWQSLAAAYHQLGDKHALTALLKQHPAAAAGIGDVHAASQDWQRAIAEYRKAAADQPDDFNLPPKLVSAYLSVAQSANDAKQYAASARAWAEALAIDPKLAEDPQKQHRYDAARAAALAAAGQGQDEPPLDDTVKAKLRRQALDWLKAEHASWDKRAEAESPVERRTVVAALTRWQKDENLSGIRDSAALAKLSAEERAAFTQFWSDTATLVTKAESEYGMETPGVQAVGQGLVLRGYLDAQTRALIYRVKLEAGTTYVFDMISPNGKALDPYLLLRDPAGKLLAEDDDSGGNQNARITFRAAQGGVHRIQATSFPNPDSPRTGAFTFAVKRVFVSTQSPPLYTLPFKSKSDSTFDANSWITGFSSDGRLCLAAGDANSAGNVPIWNAATGKLFQELLPANGVWFSNAKFLPGGSKYLVAAYQMEKDLYLWDITTGKVVRKFVGHTANNPNFVLAPDGKKLLSWCDDKSVRLWDVESGKELKKLVGHTEVLTGAAFSADSKRILTYGPDLTLRLWDAETGQEPPGTGLKKLTLGSKLGKVEAKKRPGPRGCFSPDGKYLLTYSPDSKTMQLWDIDANKAVWKNVNPLGNVTSAEFVANGRLIVGMCSDRKFRSWHTANGKLEREIDCAPFAGSNNHEHNIATAPDGRLALASHHDGTVRVLDLASGNEIHRYINCPLARGFSFSPDGTLAMAGSLRQGVFIFRLPSTAGSAARQITLKNGSATLEDELTRSDLKDTRQVASFCKIYLIQLVAGKTYQIDMKQIAGLDPYLRLEDDMGKQLAFDDDSGGFPNAQIVFSCNRSGAYRIIATTYAKEETGRFSLTVQQR